MPNKTTAQPVRGVGFQAVLLLATSPATICLSARHILHCEAGVSLSNKLVLVSLPSPRRSRLTVTLNIYVDIVE